MKSTVLITGVAGFVGFHIARRLLNEGFRVIGVDNFSSYYDVGIKKDRVRILSLNENFSIENIDIGVSTEFEKVWEDCLPQTVVHLAAQAGVRYSIESPETYLHSNLVGTFNLLELARKYKPRHTLVASSSSIYGANEELPFQETDRAASPVSFYAATKGACELMGHSYSYLYELPMTFFRFFTVYGPWGRPDMAYFKFTDAILSGREIDVYNHGNSVRDFTYIDDLVEAVFLLMSDIPQIQRRLKASGESNVAPYRVINIGQDHPTGLMDLIEAIEKATGKQAKKKFLPAQPGDVNSTHACVDLLNEITGFTPRTSLNDGVESFVNWYVDYYSVERDLGNA